MNKNPGKYKRKRQEQETWRKQRRRVGGAGEEVRRAMSPYVAPHGSRPKEDAGPFAAGPLPVRHFLSKPVCLTLVFSRPLPVC